MNGSIKNIFKTLIIPAFLLVSMAGCKKFVGLERQTDWEFSPVTLDPHVNMTAWDYLKARALGSVPADTVFRRMYDAIVYSEIDTMEYTKPGRTFIFLHNDAIRRLSSNKYTTDCYWGRDSVGTPKRPAVAWSEYPKDKVKNILLYLIVEGNHNFETLTPVNTVANTLLPAGANPNNPESTILLRVDNSGSYPIKINDFIGSTRVTTVRSGGYITNNGPMHVVDRIVDYNR
jgi:hypothetical protein